MKKIKFIENHMIVKIIIFTFLSFLYALSIRFFVKPGNILPAGLSGVTLLIQQLCSYFGGFEPSYMLINILLNLIPIYIGYKFIGKKFTLYSCIIIVGSSLFVDIIPPFETFSNDMILYAIFGGVINGFLVSLCLLFGGTSGGTDFISIYFSEKKQKDVWDYMLIFNACVLIVASLAFGIERALYSIIYQYASTEMIKLIYKHYQKSTLFIITSKPEEVYKKIQLVAHHGGTLFNGEGCYEKKDVQMIYSVVDNDLVNELIKQIKEIDSKSFIDVIKTEQINGKFYRRPTE